MSDYDRVKELFYAALERRPDQVSTFLIEACATDDALRVDVESMLAAHHAANRFIEVPAIQIAASLILADDSENIEGDRIGPYRLVREIGRGGMGTVYLAIRDDDQYHKQVAIKLIKRGMDTDFIVQRFRNERQILANLDHPNIAHLLDGGATKDGLPYFVMEYIEGKSIDEYCRSPKLPLPDLLEVFRRVCSAVHYAHQNLVIHRDLKPGNILITAGGEPKLLDFGIAKLLNSDSETEAANRTTTRLRPMTPHYASPEQVQGHHITTACDVYALGVLLYELLTEKRRHGEAAPEEIARAICEGEPEKPSVVVHCKALRGDLDNIVLMAMRKEPERRYSSAAQFSEDIRRYLQGLPVIAQKDTLGYRTEKFIRRHRTGMAAAALFVLLTAAGITAVLWQARIAARQARIAAEENAFLQNMLLYASPGPGHGQSTDVKVVEVLDQASRQIENNFNNEPEVKAELHRTIGRTYVSLRLFDRALHHAQASLDLRQQIYGERHLKVAESLAGLGGLYLVKGDYNKAIGYYEKALPMQRTLPGADELLLANMAREYAACLRLLGNGPAALPLYNEALALFRKHQQLDMIATVYNDLAALHHEQGELDAAIADDQHALEIFRKIDRKS